MVDVKSTYSPLQFSDFLVEIVSGEKSWLLDQSEFQHPHCNLLGNHLLPSLAGMDSEGKEEDGKRVKRRKESVQDEAFEKLHH